MQQELIAGGLTLLGVLVGWSLPVFYDWLQRPKLRIVLDNPEGGDNWSGHALAVTNDGGRLAKNCHGMMTLSASRENLCPDDQIVRLADLGIPARKFGIEGQEEFLLTAKDWRDIKFELLAWSPIGNPLNIDIYPHTRPLLNICRFMNGASVQRMNQLHFVSESGWASLRGAFKVQRYAMTVSVGAENAAVVHRDYLIQPKDSGDDIEIVPQVPSPKDKTT